MKKQANFLVLKRFSKGVIFFNLFIEAGFVSHFKHIEKGTFLYSDMTTPSIL